MTNFDVAIIGAGVAGAFAALKIIQTNKNIKIAIFDIGRPPQKRRVQMVGWFGLFPNSDGKFYLNDIDKVSEITGTKKSSSANKFISDYISNLTDYKTIKDKSPSITAEKRIKKFEFNVELNNYVQLYPKDIHIISKDVASHLIDNPNVYMSFDDEVSNITKQKNNFIIHSQYRQFNCKKVLICAGRSGWRWAKDLFSSFGIIENNDYAKFGIRAEMQAQSLKEFNFSNCKLSKNDLEIGPLSWNGTVIPEDHIDTAISSFRSNEDRWKTDKVSFNILGNRFFEKNGFEQVDRLAKLTFVLTNDRISKEKISTLMSGKSKISIMREYDWLVNAIKDISNIIPDLSAKGYFHVPTILPIAPKINIGNDLSTEIDGLYVAGESAGIPGLLSAALMGTIAGAQIIK